MSLGAQSFDAEVLSYLGRRHTPAQVVRAVTAARQAGFVSVNLDLIMGSPPESASSWTETLGRALDTNPDHLSTYSLTVEPGTALWKTVRAGGRPPDPDRQAECWEEADRHCAGAGLVRYEVSNAARPGHPCRYNLSVWGQGEYLGFGNGAHSFRDGRRWENLRGLDRYLDAVEAGRPPSRRFELIGGWGAETERVLLGIRRSAGVRSGRAGEALWKSPRGRELQRAGVIGLRGDRLVVERAAPHRRGEPGDSGAAPARVGWFGNICGARGLTFVTPGSQIEMHKHPTRSGPGGSPPSLTPEGGLPATPKAMSISRRPGNPRSRTGLPCPKNSTGTAAAGREGKPKGGEFRLVVRVRGGGADESRTIDESTNTFSVCFTNFVILSSVLSHPLGILGRHGRDS